VALKFWPEERISSWGEMTIFEILTGGTAEIKRRASHRLTCWKRRVY